MISIIAAVANNFAIGYENKLLYHIPEDLNHFKELTLGKTVIMGRKTFESLPNGPLPNRRNIIVSTTLDEVKGAEVYPSLGEALGATEYQDDEEVFIIGGASIYKQAMPLADKIYLTWIFDNPEKADTFFPIRSLENKELWKFVKNEEFTSKNGLKCVFTELEKKKEKS